MDMRKGLIALLSALVLVGGSTTIFGDKKESYVRIKVRTSKLSVYKQVPKTKGQGKNGSILSINRVYKSVKQREGYDGNYIQLYRGHAIGWVKSTSVVKLKHVKTNGTLKIYKTRKTEGYLVPKKNVKVLTIDVNGPQETKLKMHYKKLNVKNTQLIKKIRVTKTVWTDFGKYYQLKKSNNIGWVKASGVGFISLNSQSIANETQSKASSEDGKSITKSTLSKIDSLIKQNNIMGTLLITNNGPAGVLTRNYGYANVNKNVPNNTNEPYPLVSLEKALTGVVIQRLINQGNLKMTTQLSQFYPQIPYSSSITIRQLLDHMSGIKMGEPIPSQPLMTEKAQVEYTIQHLDSTGQHTWNYTNANFTLLSGIIKKVTGKSFMSNIDADILTPLHMKHTFLYNSVPSYLVHPLSYSFKSNQSVPIYISNNLLSTELGCGNMYASVGDFYNFVYGLISGRLVGKKGFLQLADNLKLKYSGGIYYQKNNTIRIGGADNGFHSYYYGSTDGRIAAILFTNQSSWKGAGDIDSQIQQILMQTEHS